MFDNSESRDGAATHEPVSHHGDDGDKLGRRLAAKFQEADALAALAPEARLRFVQLVRLRGRLASLDQVPAYQVISNRSLIHLAKHGATCRSDLEGVPGFGRLRINAYGDDLIAALQETH